MRIKSISQKQKETVASEIHINTVLPITIGAVTFERAKKQAKESNCLLHRYFEEIIEAYVADRHLRSGLAAQELDNAPIRPGCSEKRERRYHATDQ